MPFLGQQGYTHRLRSSTSDDSVPFREPHRFVLAAYSSSKLSQGTNTPPLIPMPEWSIIPNLPPNLGTIAALVYSTLYILMEPVAGGFLAPLIMAGVAYSKHLTSSYGSNANYWALGIHLTSWILQFIGHGVFERRAPALLDNLVQAFFLAPFFVWMEILFFFGYRPELQARVAKAVEKDVQDYQKSKLQGNGTVKNGKAG